MKEKFKKLINNPEEVIMSFNTFDISSKSSNMSLFSHRNLSFHYPSYGSALEGRTFTSDTLMKYRFGFNTQEKDDEIYGEGNVTTAEFWEYDARLGRRWNIDPVIKVWESSYTCLTNNPILFSDPMGDDVDPSRTKGMNFIVVADKEGRKSDRLEHGGGIKGFFRSAYTFDYIKAKVMQFFSGGKLNVIEASSALDASSKIIRKLGSFGYIKNLTIDFHVNKFGNHAFKSNETFTAFRQLANGHAGKQTTVLLGQCWAGGNTTLSSNLKDLTKYASEGLDGATAVGHQAANSSISFFLTRNFVV